MSDEHAANVEALRKAHEAEMAAALVREESNLLQVMPPPPGLSRSFFVKRKH